VRGVHEYLNSGACRGVPDAWFLKDGDVYWRDTDSTWYKVHVFNDEPAEEVGQVPEWDAMEF